MKHLSVVLAFLVLAVPFLSVAGSASKVPASIAVSSSLGVQEDTYVDENIPDEFFGDAGDMVVSSWVGGNTRAYIRFASIGHSFDVIDASLQILRDGTFPFSGTRVHQASRVTSDWAEGTLTWNTQPSITSVGRANVTVDLSVSLKWELWDVTEIVSAWDGGGANFGFSIRDSAEDSVTPKGAAYYTKEASEPPIQDAKLFVNWTRPFILPVSIEGFLGLIGFLVIVVGGLTLIAIWARSRE